MKDTSPFPNYSYIGFALSPTRGKDNIYDKVPQKGISGIYSIRNTINGKFYIGSTSDLKKRWLLHLNHLNSGISHSKYLQSSWNKYGGINFDFHIIEYVEKEKLLLREQYWIDELKPPYNMCAIAGIRSGIPMSDSLKQKLKQPRSAETKIKLSEAVKKSYESIPGLLEKRKQQFKKLYELNPDKGKGSNNPMYGRRGELAPKYGMHHSDAIKKKISESNKRTRELNPNIILNKLKPILQYDMNMVFIKRWASAKEAALHYKISPGSISNCCSGRSRHCHYFLWKYEK